MKVTTEKTYKDWRLPTIDELLTIVDYSKFNPVSNLKDTACDDYWSSSTYAPNKDLAWNVYFINGNVLANYKTGNGYVRCVRDGINGLEWSASSTNRMSWYEAIEYAKNLEAEVYWKENE